MDIQNLDEDSQAQGYLFPLFEQWISEVAFIVADDVRVSDRCMQLWGNIDQVLTTLQPSLIKLLLVKQQHLVDIILQFMSATVFKNNSDLWQVAVRCLSRIHTACGAFVWQSTDFSPADVTSSLLIVLELSLPEGEETSVNLKYSMQALSTIAQLISTSECFSEDTYSSWLHYLSELLSQTASGTIYKRKVAAFLQSHLFALASSARASLEELRWDILESKSNQVTNGDKGSRGLKATLPLGGSDQLLQLICTHRCIASHPQVILAVLRSHAALCSIPIPLPKGTDADYSGGSRGLCEGLRSQHRLISEFLAHLQLCVADGSLLLDVTATFRTDLISSCAALICSSDVELCGSARRLLYQSFTGQTDHLFSQQENRNSVMPIRNMIGGSSCISKYGGAILDGMLKLVSDQLNASLVDTDAESVMMCDNVDEVLEVVLEYAITRTVLYATSIGDVLKSLSDVLIAVSKQRRPKLSSSLQTTLQQGAHCGVRGCLQLIEANQQFLQGKTTAPAISAKQPQQQASYVKHSMSGGSSTGTNGVKSGTVIDLCGPERSLGSASAAGSSADGWSFLKQPSKPAPPKAPLNRLDNSISRSEASAKRAQETTWQRLEREEQEQLAQERRALMRKRIFGEVDSSANGMSAADDLMRGTKFSRADEAEWLGPLKPVPEQREDNWQDQLRELKEAKARARAQTEWKQKHGEGSSGGGGGSSGGSSRPASGSASAATAAPPRVRQSSALLENPDPDSGDDEEAPAGAPVRRVADWREFLKMPGGTTSSSSSGAAPATANSRRDPTDVSNIMALYQQALQAQQDGSARSGNRALPTIAQSLAEISIDPLIRKLLRYKFAELCEEARSNKVSADTKPLKEAPVRFLHEEDYILSFKPLLLEEVKSALVGQINGERGEDSTRSGNSPSGAGAAVKVRCVLRNARVGQPKLQEAQVVVMQPGADDHGADGGGGVGGKSSDRFERAKLMKDDLVLVMQTLPGNERSTLQDLIAHPHALALVMTAHTRNPSASFGDASAGRDKENGKNQKQQTLLMLTGCAPPQDTARWCVPVMGLSSFLREWSALMSIRNHRLVPLAPYLLKASPVVSSQHLSALQDRIVTKLKALEYNPLAMMSEERRVRFNVALLQDLTEVRGLYVDGSVLKNTGIAKTVKNITSTASRLIGPECEALAAEIIAQWKAQVKNDNNASTIRNMKGGKLIEMPADKIIERPRCVPEQLWDKFVASYNISQLFAIKYVSDQFEGGQDTRIALIQGPPGTGKTSTILGMVSALLSRSTATTSTEKSGGSNSNSTALTTTAAAASPPPGARQRLLICAPSNTAVDELLARLSGGVLDHTGQLRQVRIVRLGEPLEGASQAIQKLTLDAQIEDRLKLDPAAVKLQTAKELIRSLEREYDALPSRLKTQAYTSSSGSGSNGVYPPAGESASGNTLSKEQQKVRNLRSEIATQRQVKVWAEMNLERARNSLRQVILLEADIVGATLSGSGRKQFLDLALHNDVTFDTTIIDEAAQTTEPSCLIPLRLGCRRLVLVGDPRQLPATVLSKPAARAGLGRSLFERLERADHEVVMLTIQYRMHPEIRQFPSRFFYQNLLTDAQEALALQPLSINRTMLAPVRFLDTRATGDTPAGKSFRNEGEVQLTMNLLSVLLPSLPTATVAIITPYKAQVNRFKAALREVQEVAALQTDRRRRDLEVEVNSIDGFQGREKDVVIFSAVRSSQQQQTPHQASRNTDRYEREQQPQHRHGGSRFDTTDSHNSITKISGGGDENYAEIYRQTSAHGNGRSIGFVADERRLNVAVTRAKKLLIVVGNGRTLASDLTWSSMLQDLKDRGLVRTVNRLDQNSTGEALLRILAAIK